MQTSNIEMQLSFIAKSLELLNKDFNKRMDNLIEVLSDGRNNG